MYTRQDKNQARIGYGGYGNFGQVPSNTVTLTVGGNKITLTGPANEVGTSSALVSLLNSAVTGAKKGQIMQAQALLAKAKDMLPAAGSLRSQVEPLVAAAEREINVVPVFTSTKKGTSPLLIVGGLGAVIAVVVFLLKRK
jgi:hypothetical protein